MAKYSRRPLRHLRLGSGVLDDAATSSPTQEQLGEPVAGAHQVAAGVLAGAHQVAGRLLLTAGHAPRGELFEAQQPRQPDGVAAVGLDALAGARGVREGAATRQGTPAATRARAGS